MEATCRTCPYYFMPNHDCRKNPPNVILLMPAPPEGPPELIKNLRPPKPQPFSFFPQQPPEGWCGAHPNRTGVSTMESSTSDITVVS